MATPTIDPPKTSPAPPTPSRPFRSRRPEAPEHQELHLLIADLRDEASKSRMREAVWISVILHFILLFTIRQLPKWLPERSVSLLTPEQVLQDKNRELTYIEQAPDQQKTTIKPHTSKISDKDRVATSKTPRIDPRTLERLANNRREGAAGNNARQPFAPPQPQPAPQQLSPQQLAQNAPPPVAQTNPNARLEQPQSVQPNRNIFRNGSANPTTAVDEAVRETARNRGGGISGEYGGGPGIAGNQMRSDVEILTDTMGVDFAPYMQRVIQAIRTNWYELIPESARPPLLKQGNVYIQFVIGKDGKVSGMRLEGPSGDIALDRAAWGGITGSNPFPPLPGQFSGPYIALRIKFMYNPAKTDLR